MQQDRPVDDRRADQARRPSRSDRRAGPIRAGADRRTRSSTGGPPRVQSCAITTSLPPAFEASVSAIRAASRARPPLWTCAASLDARRGHEMHRVLLAAHDAGGGRDVVGDDPVAPSCARAWPGAFAIRSSVSAAKPTTRRGRRGPGCAMVARMSGFGTSSSAGGAAPGCFLILPRRRVRHAPVGHRGGEHRDIGRQRRLGMPSSICARALHRRTVTPGGSGTATGPLTSVTRAPSAGERRGDRVALPPAASGWRCSAPDRSARASARW